MTSLFHIGVAVSDLDKTVHFLEDIFGFTTASRRVIEHAYVGQLIGVPKVRAEIAMLEIGDGNLLELIHWVGVTGPSLPKKELNLSSIGIHHVCVYVDNAEEWYIKLSNLSEVELISAEPVVVPIGPNKGCKVFFALVLDEIYFEMFQRI